MGEKEISEWLALKQKIKQQYIANEYKHRKETNNLNNSIQEKDKRHKKTVEEKQLQGTKTYYACGLK